MTETIEPITIKSLDDLKEHYTEGVKIARNEKRWRGKVFEHKPTLRDEKIAEMDRLLAILAAMKEALKQRLISEAYQQAPLLDVPMEQSKERRPEFS